MKTRILILLLAASVGAAQGAESHPDWATLVAKGSVSIPSGSSYIAYESDMDAISKLKERGITVNSGAEFIMDGVSTTIGANVIYGNGTWIKRGTSTYTANYQYNFYGTLVIEKGIFNQKDYYPVDAERGAIIRVKDGGSYMFSTTASNGDITFEIEGDGYNNKGALIFESVGHVGKLVLNGDASITQNANGRTFAAHVYTGSGRCGTRNPGEMVMNGHALTINGSSTALGFSSVSVTGGGSISVNGSSRIFQISGSNSLSGLGSINFSQGCGLQFQNAPTPCGTKIVAKKGFSITYGNDGYTSAPAASVDVCNWTGEINLTSYEGPLTIDPGNDSRMITISGPITGVGKVSCGTSSSVAKGRVNFLAQNTYTGTTDIYGSSTFVLSLAYPLANPKGLTIHTGGIAPAPALEGGGYTWSASDIADMTKATGLSQYEIDTTQLETGALVIPSALITASRSDTSGLYWGACGSAGDYTLTGPYTTETPLNLNVLEGTVRLSGKEPIYVESGTVGARSLSVSGKLVLDGAKDVSFGDEPFSVGMASPTSSDCLSRMVITNSSFRTTHKLISSDSETSGSLMVGRNMFGILDIEAGSVLTNKLFVGGGKSFSSGWGVGAVNQFGGSLRTLTSGNASHYGSNIGSAGHGSYYLENGSFSADTLTVGGYSCGIFRQVGGEATIYGNFAPSGANGGKSEVSILGGTFRMVNKGGNWAAVSGSSGFCITTVSGKTALLSTKNSQYGMCYHLNNSTADIRIIYNLNDEGVFETCGWFCYQSTYKNTNPFIINFNGGVLRPVTYVTPFKANSSRFNPVVVIAEKGAVIDTQARDITNTGGEFTAPVEGGVQSIALPEGGLAFNAIPRVGISGDGYGASAIALWDARQLMVTNILVTSHGWGYTAANTTVTLEYYGSYGLKYTFPSSAVTIGDNDIGGLTKMGEKKLTLVGNNAWAKWTKVLGGTLAFNSGAVMPSGTVLTVGEGATLDLTNMSTSFVGISPDSAGKVENGTVQVKGTWEVELDKLPTASEGGIQANILLSNSNTIDVKDAATLQNTEYTLFRVSNDYSFQGVPRLSGLDPQLWRVKKVVGPKTTTIQIRRVKGFVIYGRY